MTRCRSSPAPATSAPTASGPAAGAGRECVGVAAAANALVFLAGDDVPELAKRLLWLCDWLGTPARVVRRAALPSPRPADFIS